MSRDTLQALQLVATGRSLREVAAYLGVPDGQVRSQIHEAISTLEARSKLEAVVIALRNGLIAIPEE